MELSCSYLKEVPGEGYLDVFGFLASTPIRFDHPRLKDAQVVNGMVPLSEMFGYATVLRSITQGRAIYTMQFSHYEIVPENIQKDILEKKQSH